MSRFRRLSQTIWHCQYHIVWVPKYRFKILTGRVAKMVESCVRAFSEQQSCEVLELNVQTDHVHIVVYCIEIRSVAHLTPGSAAELEHRPQQPLDSCIYFTSSKSLGAHVLSNQGCNGPYKRSNTNHDLPGTVWVQLTSGLPLGAVGPKYKSTLPSSL